MRGGRTSWAAAAEICYTSRLLRVIWEEGRKEGWFFSLSIALSGRSFLSSTFLAKQHAALLACLRLLAFFNQNTCAFSLVLLCFAAVVVCEAQLFLSSPVIGSG